MPSDVLVKRSETEWEIPAGALFSRINRHLRKLTPARNMYYDNRKNQYFIWILNDPNSKQGPYYYKDFSGLGRMLGLYTIKGLRLPPVTVFDRNGIDYPEKPLPPELRFAVLTPILVDAKRLLEEAGYTVTLNNQNNITIHHPDVTAPVINDYGGERPNDKYQEATDEEEALIDKMMKDEE